jgi:hypothetical protein
MEITKKKNTKPSASKSKLITDLQQFKKLGVTPEQVAAFASLHDVADSTQKTKMAWIAFWVTIILLAIGVIILAVCVISVIIYESPLVNVSIGITVVNGLLGWCFRTVLLYLFPKEVKDSLPAFNQPELKE